MTSDSLVQDVLGRLAASGGRPAITWYGDGGERVELSGAVLADGVGKRTTLWVEEYDVAPGRAVRLARPAHWRPLVWSLAAWRCGGCVALGADGPADVVVTARPAQPPAAAGALVAVALPALSRHF